MLSALCAVGLAVTKQKHTIVLIWTLKIVACNPRSSYCRSLTIHQPLDLPIWLFLQILCVLFISPLHISCPCNNRNTVCCAATIIKLPIIQISSSFCCFVPLRFCHNFSAVLPIIMCDTRTHPSTHTHAHTHPNNPPTHTHTLTHSNPHKQHTPHPHTHTHTHTRTCTTVLVVWPILSIHKCDMSLWTGYMNVR